MPTLGAGFPVSNSTAGATSVSTPSYAVGASQVLIAFVGAFTANVLALANTSITGGTLTWTRITTQNNGGTVEVWKGIPSAALTGVVTQLTWGAGTIDAAIVVYAFDSASQTMGANAANNSGVGAATLTVNAVAANSYIVGGGGDFTGAFAITADANSTKDFEAQVGDTFWSAHKTALTSAPGNTAFGTSSPTGHQWAMVGVEVKDAPAAGPATNYSRTLTPSTRGPRGPQQFRRPAAILAPDPPAPPIYWKSRSPPTGPSTKGPRGNFTRQPGAYFIPVVTGDATALAAPGTANFTFPNGKATGAALVGTAAGTASFTFPAGSAGVAVVVGASPGLANFSAPAGKATGAALRATAAGAGTFSAPTGKATGAAVTSAQPSTALFSAAPGHASAPTAAVVGTAPGIASFSSPSGHAGDVSARRPRGGVILVKSAPWGEREPFEQPGHVATAAFAAPGILRATTAGGRAKGAIAAVAGASSGSVQLDGAHMRAFPVAPAVVGGQAGESLFSHVPSAALGAARTARRGADMGASAPAGGADGAATAGSSPSSMKTAAMLARPVAYQGPDWQELAAALLFFDDDAGDIDELTKVSPLDRDRPIVNMMRMQLQQHVADFLRRLGHHIAAQVRKVGKAAADDKEGAVAASDSADYEPLRKDAEARLREVAKDGAHRGLEQVRADVARLLAQTNKRAIAWADERAGEMIVEIGDTTRARVRDLVRQAEEEGWSNDELATAIAEDGVFSDARAEMIARTETADADVQGNLIGWKESGVVAQKEWAVAQDSACDICEEFDGMVVGLDEEFPEGDPPAHPNCRCDVVPVMEEEAAT